MCVHTTLKSTADKSEIKKVDWLKQATNLGHAIAATVHLRGNTLEHFLGTWLTRLALEVWSGSRDQTRDGVCRARKVEQMTVTVTANRVATSTINNHNES